VEPCGLVSGASKTPGRSRDAERPGVFVLVMPVLAG